MATPQRLYLPNFLDATVCKELEFIHKSCGVAGYRPHVLSTTLMHLIATNCAPLILPFLPIREKVKELVEEHYGCDYELFVEFTGLISWTKGAKIGWHSDNDRPYLKQRHFTVVCYLNSHATDFSGGLFHFEAGTPEAIAPQIGDILVYRSDEIHCVDEITGGERCTLALWFTLDCAHDEDVKVIDNLAALYLKSPMADWRDAAGGKQWIPYSAASSMYLLNIVNDSFLEGPHQTWMDLDIRVARLKAFGFCFVTSHNNEFFLTERRDPGIKLSMKLGSGQDALESTIILTMERHKASYMFENCIHALQVLCFSEWREYGMNKKTILAVQQDDACQGTPKAVKHNEHKNVHGSHVWGGGSCNSLIGVFGTIGEVPTTLYVRDWEQYITENWNCVSRCLPIWKRLNCLTASVL